MSERARDGQPGAEPEQDEANRVGHQATMSSGSARVVARIVSGGAARRTAWGLFDQALSSLTNFALAVAIARQVTTEQFGAFTLAFAAYLIALPVSRAIATDPLTIRYSASEHEAWRDATSRATATAMAVGGVLGVACLAGAVVVGGDVGAALGPLAIGLPALLLQDAWRYAFFAAKRGRDAFLNDLVWTIALALAMAVVMSSGQSSISWLVLAWALAGAAGGVFGIVQARIVPAFGVPSWLREHRDIAPRMAIEGIILSGTMQILFVAVSIIAGLSSIAAVRAGQVLMNALHIVTYGAYLAIVPEGVRLLQRSTAALRWLCILVAGGLAAVAVAWGLLLLGLPDAWGRALLGETWDSARGVILPMALVTVASSVQIGAVVGLRALAAARASLRARAISSASLFLCGIGGAVLAGASGTAWGMALGVTVGTIVWWYELLHRLSAADRERAAVGEPAAIADTDVTVRAGQASRPGVGAATAVADDGSSAGTRRLEGPDA